MKRVMAAALLAAFAAAGCALPETGGPVHYCVPDSAICYLRDPAEARR